MPVIRPATIIRSPTGCRCCLLNHNCRRIKIAANNATIRPDKAIQSNSQRLFILTLGTINAGSSPNTSLPITAPVTDAIITGINPAMVYSINITSIEKITPAIGVLNDAEMAAATPQPTKVLWQLLGRCSRCPSWLAAPAPKCTAGPSRPIDWPLSKASTPPTNCIIQFRSGKRPW